MCWRREKKKKDGLYEWGGTNSKSHPSHLVAEQMCSRKKKRKENQSHLKMCDESNSHFIHTHLYCIFKQIFNSQLSNCNQIEDANHFYS